MIRNNTRDDRLPFDHVQTSPSLEGNRACGNYRSGNLRMKTRTFKPAFVLAAAVLLLLGLCVQSVFSRDMLKEAQQLKNPIKSLGEAITDRVVVYDDYAGYLHFDGRGDKGGTFSMHLSFNGFYVRPIQTMSMAKQGQIIYMPDYKDHYFIKPKSIAAQVSLSNRRHCERELTDILEVFTGSFDRMFVVTPPPALQVSDRSIAEWQINNFSIFHGDLLRVGFVVESQQADNRDGFLFLDAYAVFPGTLTTPATTSEIKGKVFFGNQADNIRRLTARAGGITWRMPQPLKLNRRFSLEDISMSYQGETTFSIDPCGLFKNLADTQWNFKYRFSIAAKKDIDATLEPVAGDEAAWWPQPGEVREYKLTLGDLDPAEVEALRFTLEEVSENKGVVTNGGNHIRFEGACDDCRKGSKVKPWQWETFFEHQGGGSYTINRNYEHYSFCPVDSLPDLYFTTTDNPGWKMIGDHFSEGLNYTGSRQMEKPKIDGKSVNVKVRVMDGAARGKLRAMVKVAGLWYDAKAKGPTAADDQTYLMLPLDKDGDGLQDKWETDWGVTDPDSDNDSLMGNRFPGDGLSVFEEYRGIYADGKYYRMSPVYKDVFVHDYSHQFKAPLRSFQRRLQDQEINLWVLNQREFKYDTINYDDSDHKNGDQYIIVVMSHEQCPGLQITWAGGLGVIGPPRRDYNTAVVKYAMANNIFGEALGLDPAAKAEGAVAGVVAHEIGHVMSCQHHGDGDGYRVLGGEDTWIACQQGEHSGDNNCTMKYNNSCWYFTDLNYVPAGNMDSYRDAGRLKQWKVDLGSRTRFCNTANGGGHCGEAVRGNCLGQINLKSY